MSILPTGADSRVGRAFARTYGDTDAEDEWERVQAYARVQELRDDYRVGGLARRLDRPQYEIRNWISDIAPKSVRGLEAAAEHGWLTPDAEMRKGFASLSGWLLSNGTLRPREEEYDLLLFRDVPDADTRLDELFARLTIDWQPTPDGITPAGAYPATDKAILTRVLLAMGLPKTTKNTLEAETLPWVLEEWGPDARLAFARTFVYNEGAELPTEDGVGLIAERWPESFVDELVALFEACAPAGTIEGQGGLLQLDADAATQLYRPAFDSSD